MPLRGCLDEILSDGYVMGRATGRAYALSRVDYSAPPEPADIFWEGLDEVKREM